MASAVSVNLALGISVTVEAILESLADTFDGFCLITYNGTSDVFSLKDLPINDNGQIVCKASVDVGSSGPDTATVSISGTEGVYIQGVAVAYE